MTLERLGRLLAYACLALACFVAVKYWEPTRVAGGSMRPALSPGDLCLISRGSEIHKGDIVLYRSAGSGRTLHRVIAVGNGVVRTKGDANPVADRERVPLGDVVGRVVTVIRVGGLVERWQSNRGLRYTSNSTE